MGEHIVTLSRRIFVSSSFSVFVLPSCSQMKPPPDIDFSAIQAASGGAMGVCAFDMTSGNIYRHHSFQRFAMCSSFKWLLGALILEKVEEKEETLERLVRISADDLVFHSPVVEKSLPKGQLTVEELCRAAIGTSDNAATNILLASLGGPEGFTARLRQHGDKVTRLDRYEPFLNENAVGDRRDTTTPMAMMLLLKDYLFGKSLERGSQIILRGWMTAANTGMSRLRAGIPAGWVSGDKTGTSTSKANNDVAFAIAPEVGVYEKSFGPVVIASFLNVPNPLSAEADAIHAKIAQEIMQAYAVKASY